MDPPLLCIVGGFLGAGKTTAILAASRRLEASGLRSGVIVNDQGHDLVDVSLAMDAALPSGRVEGGCFCCRFEHLVEELKLLLQADVDVVFAEAVGSCTDLSATVVNPLLRRHPGKFRLAPVTVVAEPRAVRDLLLQPLPRFSGDVRYLFRKQLEEADVIVLSKVDTAEASLLKECEETLSTVNPLAPVRRTHPRAGGVDGWLEALDGGTQSGRSILEVDYDRYGAAEAEMAWLNLRARVSATGAPEQFLRSFLAATTSRLNESGECLHLKAFLSGATGSFWGASTVRAPEPEIVPRGDGKEGPWSLVVNLRALADPSRVAGVVREELDRSARRAGLRVAIESFDAFRPAFPVPTYRETQSFASN